MFLSGHIKEKVGKENPPDALIVDNLETYFSTTVDKDSGNTSRSTVERFIKNIESTMFGYPVYSLDGPGTSIAVSGPHDKIFNSDFALWIGGKDFSDGLCIPIRIHKLRRALVLNQLRVEQLSSLRKEVNMRQERVVPGKHSMSALMLVLKESKSKGIIYTSTDTPRAYINPTSEI